MKESITIKNVGPLRDVYIDELKPFTVFIGESASGKSTLMKIIVLMRYIYKMLNIRFYLKNAGVSRSPFKLNINSLVHDDIATYLKSTNKLPYIKYTVSFDDETHFNIVYSNGKLNTQEIKEIPNDKLYFYKESWVSESRNVIPLWTSKAVSNKKAELGFYFYETLSDFEKATDTVTSIPMSYVGMNMQVKYQGGKKKYFVAPTDNSYQPIELKYASSGIQTSAPLVELIHYFSKEFSFKDAGRRSILDYLYEQERLKSYRPEMELMDMGKKIHIHIEEPELSLFPNAQCAMIDEIVRVAFNEKSADREIEIMMATHSPYIVNYINIILHQNKEKRAKLLAKDVAVYRIYKGGLQNLLVQTNEEQFLVNTTDLTEQMQNIMVEYQSLRKQ
ncbi:MAG: AAA family ATPase [Paludibacteraceae bacterium]|nr:AAA family ATPase [Paludibacteraceae bacterium]